MLSEVHNPYVAVICRDDAVRTRIDAARSALNADHWRIEAMMVACGHRPAATTVVPAAIGPAAAQWLAGIGLEAIPLHYGMEGEDHTSVFAVARAGQSTAARLAEGWYEADHERIGELLGYPGCCREAFARNFCGHDDDTLLTLARTCGDRYLPESLPILHRTGLRLYPHHPCSFTCTHTASWADLILQSSRRHLGERISSALEVTRDLLVRGGFTLHAHNGLTVICSADLLVISANHRYNDEILLHFADGIITRDTKPPRINLQEHPVMVAGIRLSVVAVTVEFPGGEEVFEVIVDADESVRARKDYAGIEIIARMQAGYL